MPPTLPLDALASQISFLVNELAMTGRWLLPSLEKPLEALKSGRSPRALDLGSHLAEPQEYLRIEEEILWELQALLPQLRDYLTSLGREHPDSPDVRNLAQQVPVLEKEVQFWQSYVDRAKALLKKLQLISEEEKLSPLARAPLQDAWEEVLILTKGGVNPR